MNLSTLPRRYKTHLKGFAAKFSVRFGFFSAGALAPGFGFAGVGAVFSGAGGARVGATVGDGAAT